MSEPNQPYQPGRDPFAPEFGTRSDAPSPFIGATPPSKRRFTPKRLAIGTAAGTVLAIIIGVSAGGGGETPEAPAAAQKPAATASPSTPVTQAPASKAPAAAATKAPTTTAPKPTPKKLTAEQEQAIGTAQDYLDYSHFSRSGLIKQLKYEGFSTADATYAVDSLKVNWNQQAVGAAKDYLAYSHFSRQGLIHQLEYEGFTTAQAKYGATGAGL